MKYQKRNKALVICVLAIVSFLVLAGCFVKPTTIHNSNVSQFGHFNADTESFIQKKVRLLFPEVIQAGMTIDNYDYYFQSSFLGDPSFCIFAEISFESTSDFEKEKQRIIDNSDLILSADNREVYMSKKSSNLEYYLDDVVYDGLAIFIECAIVFEDEHIEYLYANWQDSAEKNDFLDTIALDYAESNYSVTKQ